MSLGEWGLYLEDGFVNSIVSLRWVWENEDYILKMGLRK